MKKLIALLLSVVLLIGCVAISVTANNVRLTTDEISDISNWIPGYWSETSGAFVEHNKRIATKGLVAVNSSTKYTLAATGHGNMQFYLVELDADENFVAGVGRTVIGNKSYSFTTKSSTAYIALTLTIQSDAVVATNGSNGIIERWTTNNYSITLVGEENEPEEEVSTVPTEPKPTTPPPTAGDLTDKLTDTSDFTLSSIAYTEQMLIGFNIGNGFETTELRPAYVRPTISDVNQHIDYKETMAGNVLITEDFIKYLKSIGIQTVRLPVTWFNMLEDENGNIYPKDTWYGDIETRKKAWYTGKINEEFLARVKQVVDWIIENDMYCIINTHHDAACNSTNYVNPIKMEEAYKEQTYNYLKNIWGQVGNYFKNYGSKLMFEFYNEATSNSGHMTPNSTADAFVADLLCELIPFIRAQGGNNTNRFLVCPRYGGVSFWTNSDSFQKFIACDSADDKLIITTHTYTTANGMNSGVKNARTKMEQLGVGAIIDEIGSVDGASNASQELVNVASEIRKSSDQYKVCCYYWDGGLSEAALINRYYNSPATPALAAYVGKDLQYEVFTKSEVIAKGAASKQPNWVEFCTPNFDSTFGKKYTIFTTTSKIKSLDLASGTKSRGAYTLTCEEQGLTTYYVSDDGVNYTHLNTFVTTDWCKIAWDEFNLGGSTYKTYQMDGNYKVEKIGYGLDNYVASGENLIKGEWQKGHYASGGKYEGEGTTYYNKRISLVDKIDVTAGAYYVFESNNKNYHFIIRSYNAKGGVYNLSTIDRGIMQMPSDAVQISVSLYDPNNTSTKAEDLLALIESGELKLSIHRYEKEETKTTDLISIQNGAAIRLNEVSGMRFYASVNNDLSGADEVGIIIAPKDLVDDDFTMQDTHAKVVYDISKGLFDGQYVVGSIVNIKEGNITRDFVARGYVVIDGVTYYTEETIARNISSVADAFIADEFSGYADLDADKKELVDKWAKAND